VNEATLGPLPSSRATGLPAPTNSPTSVKSSATSPSKGARTTLSSSAARALLELHVGLTHLEVEEREVLVVGPTAAADRLAGLQQGPLRLRALGAQGVDVARGDAAEVEQRLRLGQLTLDQGEVPLGGGGTRRGLGDRVGGAAAGPFQLDAGLGEGELGPVEGGAGLRRIEADERVALGDGGALAGEDRLHAAGVRRRRRGSPGRGGA
jgi:hypothetical protein